MTEDLIITICGGGNLAHAQAAYLARKGYTVNIFTRRPEAWHKTLKMHCFDGDEREVKLGEVTADPIIVAKSDIVIISLPRFSIPSVSEKILPWLTDRQLVVYAPGSPWLQTLEQDIQWKHKNVCALYKVPFICRTEKYGQEVSVLGSRDVNRVWFSSEKLHVYMTLLESLFDTPLQLLSSSWPFILTNSNPLLHPSRLTVMFKDYKEGVYYDRNFLFYEEWTNESSERYIEADKELLRICEACPGMKVGVDIIPVTEYYESPDAAALTRKINSIAAFKGIQSPMKQLESGWIPDFASRYFTEDVEWGTALICDYARKLGIETPVLDYYVTWTRMMLSRYS